MIGEALRLIRVYHDTKLVDLAKQFDVSVSFLSEVENNHKKPNIELIDRYAKHFELRPSAIMFFSEELNEKSLKGKAKSEIRKKMLKFMQLIEKYKTLEQE